ncbi:DUF4270 domain-containing protein [Chitinophagaceae bacterium LB-8]|uniref:DUF4270 domain-containing protein n=1 Tax=Paraflavisolibacter caeni TaxID=2982496 RepID=A0A9X2XPF6_9BACT|nr:DUF4270 family protein [Paraflavisolibacter caeni]MCU7550754.1 DUF4270 domain-containing protein [Paraflavisolibacter caeni]
MNKRRWVASLVLGLTGILFLISSCKKINEATELGGDLIPPVDNVNTFETYFAVESDNILFNDTTKILASDLVGIGHIGNDPEFGQTHGDAYFNVSSSAAEGAYPFVDRDSLLIDSVVLSLRYSGKYGDTNSMQTVRVFEIAQNSGFVDTAIYKFSDGIDYATAGSELGSKNFALSSLKDSLTVINGSDTQRVANVLRIKLDTELGRRLASYDTAYGPNGGYNKDSIFYTLFRGLAIKADAAGNGLGYFNLFDNTNTKLSVYFRTTINGVKDTSVTDFVHHARTTSTGASHPGGVANPIKRTPAGGWATYLNNGQPQDDKVYLQSAPGSYANLRIPALDTFGNNVIHLAELIIYKQSSELENVLTPPVQLMLDKINYAKDTAFNLENDLPITASAAIPFSSFGGQLKFDNTFRFNISRHVQGIVTRKEPNYTLRLYAPLSATVYDKKLNQKVTMQVLDKIADGRVVLAGGNFGDPAMRMRVRIVYSKI